jgi:putative transposase
MARLPRFNLPGQPQHVIIRGNNKTPIFLKEENYRFYLETIGQAIEKYPCELHAYILMTNHVHLLITPQHESALSKAIQSIGRIYVQYFNL